MNLETVEKLIELVRKHSIHQIEVEEGGTRISVTAQAAGVTAAPAMYQPQPPMMSPYLVPSHAPAAMTAVPPPPPSGEPARADGPRAVPTGKGRVVHSPFVGTFYRSPSPGADTFVEVGKRVKKGDPLCIIEAMKLMNEIEAEFDGVIKEILVDNESPVEFDQPLFVME
jgi:acetyl-CoA carboxylase biotin carboxyl carrier protein